jgi:iron complex outermembrane receptor protein
MSHATHEVRPHFSALSSAIADSLQTALATARRPSSGGVRSAVISASGGILVTSALAAALPAVVAAQEAAQGAPIEEVTVTGSRIRRDDFTANAPVVSVSEAMFDQTTSIGVETILNRLPQFTPAVTQFTTADVQQTATNTVGVSTVSLRGLGPNRNLVLINGRRAMPVDPTMVIDTNSIPSSAIQRVEIISGGASAVYGADAVGGVVNFILKDNFEGVSVDVRLADTEHGGNQEITTSVLLGANVADDRGNVMLGVERATRSLQRQWERDWRLEDFANPSSPGGTFEWGSTPWIRNEVNFSSPVPNVNTNLPIQSSAALAAWRAAGNDRTPLGTATCVDCIFSELPPGTIPNNVNAVNYRTNDDGTIFTGMGFAQDGPTMAPGGYRFNGPLYDPNIPGSGGNHQGEFAGLPVFVQAPNGYIKENNLYAWASSPLERLSSFANGHFDLSDSVRVTAQASLTRTQTQSSLGATAANINQWAAAVPFGNQLYRGNNTPLYPGAAPDRSI